MAAYATGDNGLLARLNNGATSVADVFSAAGRFASSISDRTAAASASTSTAFLAVTSSTADLFKTMWQGVDLYELRGEVFVGKVLFADAHVAGELFGDAHGIASKNG